MNNAHTPLPPHPQPLERLHALDNLRALMMWLGIVLHVAINHLTVDSPLPWRDPKTSPVADLLLLFIHSFRMPVFFVLAGFFVALLAERRGANGMLKNRCLRLALPFAIFWPPLFAATMRVPKWSSHSVGVPVCDHTGGGSTPSSVSNS